VSVAALLAPVFAQVLLTVVLLFWMGRERLRAVRSGAMKGQPRRSPRLLEWPERAQQVADSYHNQFELPALFYLATLLALATRGGDLPFVALAWTFVATRYVHAYVHTGANRTSTRFSWFLAGALVLIALWIWLGLGLLSV
jgi:hypothetical protein